MINLSRAVVAGILVALCGPAAAGAEPIGVAPVTAPVAADRATTTSAVRSGPEQIVTVRVGRPSSTHARISLWRRQSDGSYLRKHGPYRARIGVNGVGRAREGRSTTPAGVFTLTQAFGNRADPGTRVRYFRAGPRDWWDENPASPTYNRHVVRSSSPGGASENLYYAGPAYAHAVVIDYNTRPVVAGAGSGFFLHVTQHAATAGCVATSKRHLITIMRWLSPGRHPVISIGVGARATRILHAPV